MSEKNQHWKMASETPYLGSWDLANPDAKSEKNYIEIKLTISHVKFELSEGLKDNDMFNIAYFKEDGPKPMLLNSTNSKAIKFITGSPMINKWIDVPVTIYVEENVKAFGDLHDALRIRKIKIIPKPVLNPQSPKWDLAHDKVLGGMKLVDLRKHYQITDANYKLLQKPKTKK